VGRAAQQGRSHLNLAVLACSRPARSRSGTAALAHARTSTLTRMRPHLRERPARSFRADDEARFVLLLSEPLGPEEQDVLLAGESCSASARVAKLRSGLERDDGDWARGQSAAQAFRLAGVSPRDDVPGLDGASHMSAGATRRAWPRAAHVERATAGGDDEAMSVLELACLKQAGPEEKLESEREERASEVQEGEGARRRGERGRATAGRRFSPSPRAGWPSLEPPRPARRLDLDVHRLHQLASTLALDPASSVSSRPAKASEPPRLLLPPPPPPRPSDSPSAPCRPRVAYRTPC